MFKEIALTFYLCKLFILLDHQQFLIPVKGKTKSSRVLYPLENYYIQPFKSMDPAQLRLYGTLCVLVSYTDKRVGTEKELFSLNPNLQIRDEVSHL